MIALWWFGCDAAEQGGAASDWADVVLAAPGASDTAFHDPDRAVNGARGAGWFAGSTDVYSLTFDPDDALVLGWSGRRVVDSEGPDLVVFENVFALDDGQRFLDPVRVEVSPDGVDFVAFDHAYTGPLDGSTDPADWAGFAGRTPTLLNEDTNPVDPFDAVAAGGDAFDLADLPAGDPIADAILADGVAAVRLTAACADDAYPAYPLSNGPDIDAIYARATLSAFLTP